LPAILPSQRRSSAEAMTSSGVDSVYASATAVATLVTPGPVMISATAGLPEARA
jgi:hypothetical protein